MSAVLRADVDAFRDKLCAAVERCGRAGVGTAWLAKFMGVSQQRTRANVNELIAIGRLVRGPRQRHLTRVYAAGMETSISRLDLVVQAVADHPGLTRNQIAQATGIQPKSVHSYIKKAYVAGRLTYKRMGQAPVTYWPTAVEQSPRVSKAVAEWSDKPFVRRVVSASSSAAPKVGARSVFELASHG